MITKKSFLSLALFSLMLSSSLSLCAQAQQNTLRKTTTQRIVSGLAHTVLLVPSLLYSICLTSADFKGVERPALGVLGIRTSYDAAKGIYCAIAESEADPEKPTELNGWTAADSALCIPSLLALRFLFKPNTTDSTNIKIFFSLPAVYALGISIKTIYKLVQSRQANPDDQEPEIQTITE